MGILYSRSIGALSSKGKYKMEILILLNLKPFLIGF
jgi:hypothetical protein